MINIKTVSLCPSFVVDGFKNSFDGFAQKGFFEKSVTITVIAVAALSLVSAVFSLAPLQAMAALTFLVYAVYQGAKDSEADAIINAVAPVFEDQHVVIVEGFKKLEGSLDQLMVEVRKGNKELVGVVEDMVKRTDLIIQRLNSDVSGCLKSIHRVCGNLDILVEKIDDYINRNDPKLLKMIKQNLSKGAK